MNMKMMPARVLKASDIHLTQILSHRTRSGASILKGVFYGNNSNKVMIQLKSQGGVEGRVLNE